jgi:exopolysaccharide biosynthesis WecB/TagA/CpsF family protein
MTVEEPRTSPSGDSVVIQGVRVDVGVADAVVRRLERAVRAGAGGCTTLFFVNAHTINLARRDPEYASILNRGDLVLNDGAGVKLAARMKGVRFAANFCGTDFVPELLGRLGEEGVRAFLLGGRPGRAEGAAVALERDHPGVVVVGHHHGYGSDDAEVVRRINESGAEVLLVAMGNPLQERWIDRHRQELEVPLAVGVGALLDFLAGAVPRAPGWLRRLELEWFYRLYREPRRMFGRYVVGNPAFLGFAMLDALTGPGRGPDR